MDIDSIKSQMQAVVDEANGAELSDEQITRYEDLEGQLTRANKTEAIQRRNAAYNAVATPALIGGVKEGDEDAQMTRAFDHYMRTGQINSDLVEARAQSEGTSSAGGYTVPKGFRAKLVERMKAFGGLANAVEEITTATGGPLEWPTLDDTANEGEIVAENGTFAAGADLVFGTATLGAYKYMAGGASSTPLRVSWELLQDSAFDIESLVARKLGERIARTQAKHWVNGTGSSQPKGIVTGKVPIELATLTYAGLLGVVHSVDPAYRENGKWSFNDTTLAAIRGIVDTTGRPLLVDQNRGIEGALGGPTLLGYPVVIDQAFASYDGADDDLNMGVFGDLQEAYVIRRVKDITLVVDPYTRAANGQTQFSCWARADGTQQNTNAYVAFSGAEA